MEPSTRELSRGKRIGEGDWKVKGKPSRRQMMGGIGERLSIQDNGHENKTRREGEWGQVGVVEWGVCAYSHTETHTSIRRRKRPTDRIIASYNRRTRPNQIHCPRHHP